MFLLRGGAAFRLVKRQARVHFDVSITHKVTERYCNKSVTSSFNVDVQKLVVYKKKKI